MAIDERIRTGPAGELRGPLAVAVAAALMVVVATVVVRLSATPVAAIAAAGLLALLRSGLGWRALRTPLDLAVVAGLAAGALAFVVNGHGGSRLWAHAVFALVFYLLVGVQLAWRHARTALALAAAATVATTALVAVGQWFLGWDTGYCRAEIVGGADSCERAVTAVRVVGTLTNPNLLAPVLVLLVPVGCVALRRTLGQRWGRRPAQAASIALGALGTTALVMTLSRGGLVSLAALTVAALALRNPSSRTLVGSALGVAAGIAVAFGALFAKFSLGPRTEVWKVSLDLVREHPWGVGLGRSGPFIDQRIPGDQRFFHSHNLWLTWLVEAGLPGLLAALALSVALVVVVVRGARRGDALSVAAGVGLAGFAVISLFDNPSFRTTVAVPLWTVVAILVAGELEARRRR
ncbi:MAG TPA: O-antigen ligase family protein [Nocardioides sp.]